MVLIPADEEQTLTFRQDDSDDDPMVKSRLIEPGRFYTQSDGTAIEVKTSSISLPGSFSVGSLPGDKVQFSRGNMYWDGQIGKFKMETKQWKPVMYLTFCNPDNMKFFFWSSDAEVARSLSYDDGYISSNDVLFTNQNVDSPNPDFVAEGEKDWRVLSYAEWTYLLDSRLGNRFAKARLNDVNGLLIYPDDYSGVTSGQGIGTANSKSASFPSQSIPSDTWAVMESNGVVFLPASGYRNEGTLYGYDQSGRYWTSSRYDNNRAYVVYFSKSSLTINYDNRSYGYSVRLVRNISIGEVNNGDVNDFEPATWGE